MRSGMSFQAKKELLLQTWGRYNEARGKAKTTILDEFVLATGYDRKYAIRLLTRPSLPPLVSKIRRPRASKYGVAVQDALKVAWAATNFICGKRLVPFLPELLPLLEHHGHLVLQEDVRAQLLSVSAATADRLLSPSRQKSKGRGASVTKPGKRLKHQIPLRTFTDWEDTRVGFFEMDLVAHCGTNIAGTFLWSLVMTDVASGWTECFPLLQRSGQAVVQALQHLQKILPFRILGLDTDNGSEFINDDLMEFCKDEQITFTRGRVHRKNDQCFVEQKNGSIVRQTIGYDRYDGLAALRQMAELYRALRLYVNLFQPSMKLKTKSRDGAKCHRTYSPARTPLQRIVASQVIAPDKLEELESLRVSVDPVTLLHVLEAMQVALWRHANLAPLAGADEGDAVPKVTFDVDSCTPDSNRARMTQPTLQSGPRRYRKSGKPRKPRTHRTRRDPFEDVDEELYRWFLAAPQATAKSLLEKLQRTRPDSYPDHLLRTLQRKVRRWRASTMIELVSPEVGKPCPGHRDSPDGPVSIRGIPFAEVDPRRKSSPKE